MANGQPKPAFYVAVFVVILGLVGLALYRFGAIGTKQQTGQISGDELKQMQKGAEAPDASGITTVKEYNFKPAEKLPPVKGTSAYKPLADHTVRFALNVWAGWAPIILANNGFKAGKVWKTADGKHVQGRARADRQPGGRCATPTPRARSTSAGRRSTWCRSSWRLRRQGNPRQPDHAAHLPAGRLVQRRRRHRRPREHQDRGRPARQEARAGAELAVALLRRSTCWSPAACSRPKWR